jgi:hypothetical protein
MSSAETIEHQPASFVIKEGRSYRTANGSVAEIEDYETDAESPKLHFWRGNVDGEEIYWYPNGEQANGKNELDLTEEA